MVSANTKQNRRQNRGVFAHKGAQTSAVIKFLSVLTTHTGATCNQPVELMKDWSSDRGGVPDLSVSGDKSDLVVVDPHDPTTTSKLEAPMQSLNQLPMVTNLAGARSA
jgi:hypothetical protein